MLLEKFKNFLFRPDFAVKQDAGLTFDVFFKPLIILVNKFKNSDLEMENAAGVSEIYKTVRKQIETVNGDTGQRIIWLAIGQSFFFSAYAVLTTGKPAVPQNGDLYKLLLTIIPIIALLYTFFTFLDVLSSLYYMAWLRKYYMRAPKDEKTDRLYPPIHGTRTIRFFLYISPAILPLVFFVSWWILISTHLHSQ